MAKNIEHLQHVKSSRVVTENGVINSNEITENDVIIGPKLPNASALTEGEIAINYVKDYETISIKNTNEDIIAFSSDDYYTKKKLGSGFTGENSAKTVTEVIEDNELVLTNTYISMSGAVSSHTENSSIHLTQTEKDNLHYHSNIYELDSITGDVGTMAYENASSYSSATEVSSALGNKLDTDDFEAYSGNVDTLIGSGFTSSSITDVIIENEYISSMALNRLNANKLDVSAYTPTSESSGVTAMTGYEIAASGSPISSGDTLNQAIGKLEKKNDDLSGYVATKEFAIASSLVDLDGRKLDASAYTPTIEASGVTAMTGYQIASSSASVLTTDTLLQVIGKLEKRISLIEGLIVQNNN